MLFHFSLLILAFPLYSIPFMMLVGIVGDAVGLFECLDKHAEPDWFLPYVVTFIGDRASRLGNNDIVIFNRYSKTLGYPCILENTKPTSTDDSTTTTNTKIDKVPTYEGKILYAGNTLTSVWNFFQSLLRLPRLFVRLKDERPFLLYMHGFSVAPEEALKRAASYNSDPDRAFNVIPIVWDTTQFPLSYAGDRTRLAPDAAQVLGRSFGRIGNLFPVIMNQGPKKFLMCHSMGNYVLQGFAQAYHDGFAPFDHIFMVAADVREDIFDTSFNNYTRTFADDVTSTYYALKGLLTGHIMEDRNDVDSLANPGKEIASLARHKVHVLWSKNDKALLIRRLFQKSPGKKKPEPMEDQDHKTLGDNGIRNNVLRKAKRAIFHRVGRRLWRKKPERIEVQGNKALGANGIRNDIHQDLKDKVIFHNCDDFNSNYFSINHNYQWEKQAIEYYAKRLRET